jgi:hypothetical protein
MDACQFALVQAEIAFVGLGLKQGDQWKAKMPMMVS